jgi:hypothetical protein
MKGSSLTGSNPATTKMAQITNKTASFCGERRRREVDLFFTFNLIKPIGIRRSQCFVGSTPFVRMPHTIKKIVVDQACHQLQVLSETEGKKVKRQQSASTVWTVLMREGEQPL